MRAVLAASGFHGVAAAITGVVIFLLGTLLALGARPSRLRSIAPGSSS